MRIQYVFTPQLLPINRMGSIEICLKVAKIKRRSDDGPRRGKEEKKKEEKGLEALKH